MITVTMGRFEKADINANVYLRERDILADKIGNSLVNYLKLEIASRGAIATGDTLRSVRMRHGSALVGVASSGVSREIVANRGLRHIISGRRAGAKMPVIMTGRGKRGGKIFEPLPALVEWFNAVGIPQTAWFPVLRAISRRGIPAKPVHTDAIRRARPIIRKHLTQTGLVFQRQLLVKNAG